MINELDPLCESIKIDESIQNIIISINNRNRKVFQSAIICATMQNKIKMGVSFNIAIKSELNHLPITGLKAEFFSL